MEKFKGEYYIVLDPSVPPVVHLPWRVPMSLKNDIRKELDEVVRNDVLENVVEGEPTQWVNSLVYCLKPNGMLRLCLDPKNLKGLGSNGGVKTRRKTVRLTLLFCRG